MENEILAVFNVSSIISLYGFKEKTGDFYGTWLENLNLYSKRY